MFTFFHTNLRTICIDMQLKFENAELKREIQNCSWWKMKNKCVNFFIVQALICTRKVKWTVNLCEIS